MRWPNFQFSLRMLVAAVVLVALNMALIVSTLKAEARQPKRMTIIYGSKNWMTQYRADGSVYKWPMNRPNTAPMMVSGPTTTPLRTWGPSAASAVASLVVLLALSRLGRRKRVDGGTHPLGPRAWATTPRPGAGPMRRPRFRFGPRLLAAAVALAALNMALIVATIRAETRRLKEVAAIYTDELNTIEILPGGVQRIVPYTGDDYAMDLGPSTTSPRAWVPSAASLAASLVVLLALAFASVSGREGSAPPARPGWSGCEWDRPG